MLGASAQSQLLQAAKAFQAQLGYHPEFVQVSGEIDRLVRHLESPGDRVVRAVTVRFDFDDDAVIDAPPNHAGQVPSTTHPDA